MHQIAFVKGRIMYFAMLRVSRTGISITAPANHTRRERLRARLLIFYLIGGAARTANFTQTQQPAD